MSKINDLIEKLQYLSKLYYKKNVDLKDIHVEADQLLLKFINNPEVTKAFNSIVKWCA